MIRKPAHILLCSLTFSLTAMFSYTPSVRSQTYSNCINWTTYQATERLRNIPGTPSAELFMPLGFENGCVFRVFRDLEETVYILKNGLSLDQIVAPGVSTHRNYDYAPWLGRNQIDYDLVAQLKSRGDILTYFQGCATAEGYILNCADRPMDRPYAVLPNTVCVQGFCINSNTMNASELLPLWGKVDSPWTNPLWAVWDVARSNYEAIPWHMLPNYPPRYSSSPEAIALHLYGRQELGEGEGASVVAPAQYYEQGYAIVLLTNWGLADDATGAIQYRLEFEPSYDGQFNLIWAGARRYCKRAGYWTSRYSCP